MSKSQISFTKALTASYVAVGSGFFKGDLIAPDTNAATAYLQGSDAGPSDIPMAPGSYHDYSAVDLATIYVKGTPGDTVTLVGEGVVINAMRPR